MTTGKITVDKPERAPYSDHVRAIAAKVLANGGAGDAGAVCDAVDAEDYSEEDARRLLAQCSSVVHGESLQDSAWSTVVRDVCAIVCAED